MRSMPSASPLIGWVVTISHAAIMTVRWCWRRIRRWCSTIWVILCICRAMMRRRFPLLRRALAAVAPGGPSPAQRILTMIAARVRTKVVASETAIARAEVAAPTARVELTASGEQRLVFAAAAPDAEVVARLGDAAPLISVAEPWSAADDAVVAAEAAEAVPVPIFVAALAPPEPVIQLADDGIEEPRPALLTAPQRWREGNPALPVTGAAALIEIGRAPRHPMRANRPADGPALAPVVAASPAKLTIQPAVPVPLPPAPIVLLSPVVVAAFDSDDDELNAFAARMVAWRSGNAAECSADAAGRSVDATGRSVDAA